MTIDLAVKLIELLIAFAFIMQSAEHITEHPHKRPIYILRLLLSLLLLTGVATPYILGLLFITHIVAIHQFNGPYNGGADKMGLLILICLIGFHIAPSAYFQEIAIGYLAMQLVLSYVISGWVKIRNPNWRSGQSLADVFWFSAYPTSKALRHWHNRPKLMFAASWTVIIFELIFPVALLHGSLLIVALSIAALFHLANALLFGLNRFFWIWISAYPSLIWLQERLV